MVKQLANTGQHKLANIFGEAPYVVVQCNSDRDVYLVRPAEKGVEKWVNRQMLILDPRRESVEPPDSLEGLPDASLVAHCDKAPGEDGSDDDQWVLTCDPPKPETPTNPPVLKPPSKSPSSFQRSDISTPSPVQTEQTQSSAETASASQGLRRSKRLQEKLAGQWPNAIT